MTLQNITYFLRQLCSEVDQKNPIAQAVETRSHGRWIAIPLQRQISHIHSSNHFSNLQLGLIYPTTSMDSISNLMNTEFVF